MPGSPLAWLTTGPGRKSPRPSDGLILVPEECLIRTGESL